jgi:hypothetical protein
MDLARQNVQDGEHATPIAIVTARTMGGPIFRAVASGGGGRKFRPGRSYGQDAEIGAQSRVESFLRGVLTTERP